MKKNSYVRTDLAAELPVSEGIARQNGITVSTEIIDQTEICTVTVSEGKGEAVLGKPAGRYVTLSFEKLWLLTASRRDKIAKIISSLITDTALRLTKGKKLNNILVAGLGNRFITADAVGPLTVKKITVTGHLQKNTPEIFKALECHSVSAIAPGVLAQTGIESFSLIKGAAEASTPDLVIAVDALAAQSPDRLATTLQLCDTGIAPGSGIGNRRHALNQSTLGIPVIAIGVPTMISSSTLVYTALEKAGIKEINHGLASILENGKSFFVTLNESDRVVDLYSDLIADGINKAFGGAASAE